MINGILVIGKVAGVKNAFEVLKHYDFSQVKRIEFLKGAIFGKYGVKVLIPAETKKA